MRNKIQEIVNKIKYILFRVNITKYIKLFMFDKFNEKQNVGIRRSAQHFHSGEHLGFLPSCILHLLRFFPRTFNKI